MLPLDPHQLVPSTFSKSCGHSVEELSNGMEQIENSNSPCHQSQPRGGTRTTRSQPAARSRCQFVACWPSLLGCFEQDAASRFGRGTV